MTPTPLSRWHFHWGHVSFSSARYRYRVCRCGARRTTFLRHNGYVPLVPGWPAPYSGWVQPANVPWSYRMNSMSGRLDSLEHEMAELRNRIRTLTQERDLALARARTLSDLIAWPTPGARGKDEL